MLHPMRDSFNATRRRSPLVKDQFPEWRLRKAGQPAGPLNVTTQMVPRVGIAESAYGSQTRTVSAATTSQPNPSLVRWLPWVVAALLALGALGVGAGFGIKAKAVIAGTVTLAYDPLTSKVSIAADPLHLASRFVTVKLGDEVSLVPKSDEVMVVIDSLLNRSSFLVPKEGAWSVTADQVAGGSIGMKYDGTKRLFRVDLSHVYAKSISLQRGEGTSSFDTKAIEKRFPTRTLTVDTSLLTTGDFTYCTATSGRGGCGLYLHAIANLSPDQRVQSRKGDPVRVPNGAKVSALCEAGGAAVSNDLGQSSKKWEYVVFDGYVGYLPSIWTGTADAPVGRVCG